MMMYYRCKFGCERIRSSVGMVQKVILWLYQPLPCVTLPWKQQSNRFAQHSGSWSCTAIPSLVTKGSVIQKISFAVTLTLKHQSNIFRTLWLMTICHQTKFSCKIVLSLEDNYSRNSHILIIQVLTMTSALKIAPWRQQINFHKSIFLHDRWVMMTQHQTKSDYKRLSGSEDTTWTKTRRAETVISIITLL